MTPRDPRVGGRTRIHIPFCSALIIRALEDAACVEHIAQLWENAGRGVTSRATPSSARSVTRNIFCVSIVGNFLILIPEPFRFWAASLEHLAPFGNCRSTHTA